MQFDEEALNVIREQIKAEYKTALQLELQNKLAAESLNKLERTRQAEEQRNRLWMDISESTANVVQQFPELIYQISVFNEKLEGFADHIKEITDRLDRMEIGIMLLLSMIRGNGNKLKAEELARDIDRDRKQRLIDENKRRLHELKLKQAQYGRLSAPAHLITDIEDLTEEIAQLEQDL